MDRLIQDFVKDCSLRGMSPRSIPHYGYITNTFKGYLESKGANFQDVDKDHLMGFIDCLRIDKGAAGKTVENYFAVLSTFYDYLASEGVVSSNPVLPIRRRYLRRYKDNGSIQERQLITLDVDDVDLIEMKIRLKPTAKRTNRIVFFDAETAFVLRRWLKLRKVRNKKDLKALFLNSEGNRLDRGGILRLVGQAAERVGLHDPESARMEDHFSPHCCDIGIQLISSELA